MSFQRKAVAFLLLSLSLAALYFFLGESPKIFLGVLIFGSILLCAIHYLYKNMYIDE